MQERCHREEMGDGEIYTYKKSLAVKRVDVGGNDNV
jgi:hypothetical protein